MPHKVFPKQVSNSSESALPHKGVHMLKALEPGELRAVRNVQLPLSQFKAGGYRVSSLKR